MNKNLQNGIIKTVPKKWSKEEETLIVQLKNKALNNQVIEIS